MAGAIPRALANQRHPRAEPTPCGAASRKCAPYPRGRAGDRRWLAADSSRKIVMGASRDRDRTSAVSLESTGSEDEGVAPTPPVEVRVTTGEAPIMEPATPAAR
jgi:hypothetical protein